MQKDKKISASKPKEQQEKRRSFLKKVAYAAPTLIVLGQLTRPSDAKAGFGGPPSDPSWPPQ